MTLEDEFTAALIDGYRRAGEEVGYWGTRFLQAVRRSGGVATARRMLKPRSTGQRAGLDALLEANRPDLTVEAIVISGRFSSLFTEDETREARDRLGDFGRKAAVIHSSRERLYPDELGPGVYVEGAKKQVRVNAYERNPKARKACISHYGTDCFVCGFAFSTMYGAIGDGFVHVHHLRPLGLSDGEYELDPIQDLRPVCPNCHAMLHRPDIMLSVEELQEAIRLNRNS
jgi:5-methylcytosine-specific restriction protein A